jgi:hypothetical protein
LWTGKGLASEWFIDQLRLASYMRLILFYITITLGLPKSFPGSYLKSDWLKILSDNYLLSIFAFIRAIALGLPWLKAPEFLRILKENIFRLSSSFELVFAAGVVDFLLLYEGDKLGTITGDAIAL